jgi:hypothetical protein
LHEVQYGQTLWSIAITYGTTIEQIRRLNNLGDSTTVYERQVLLVQKGATQPAPPTVGPTQTAATVFSTPSPSTPSPIVTLTEVAAGTARPLTYQSTVVVLVVIIGLSLGLAALGAGFRVKTPE